MLPLWLNLLLVVATFFFMEFVAWFTHKYVMHGFLWVWHESHHRPYNGIFEMNDLFGVVFALPAVTTMVLGLEVPSLNFLFWIGCGITAYGIFYVVFHDIIVHRRVKHGYRAKSAYMKRMIKAHKVHHKVSSKYGAESFGFLVVRKKYAVPKQADLTA